jgi:hypothetical protein
MTSRIIRRPDNWHRHMHDGDEMLKAASTAVLATGIEEAVVCIEAIGLAP